MDCILLDDTFSIGKQPNNIKIPLKIHQLTLMNRCSILEKSINKSIQFMNIDNSYSVPLNTEEHGTLVEFKSKMGIIGDIVGSGKTLSILSVIANNKNLNNDDLPNVFKNKFIYYKEEIGNEDNIEKSPYNIIVVPHTIFKQWRDTLTNYSSLTFFEIFNKKSFEKFCDIFNDVNNDGEYKEFSKYNIILISNTKYNIFANLYLTYWRSKCQIFSRLIFDEGDSINIPSCKSLKASFTWFISSSYKSLLNPSGSVCYMNIETGETSPSYSYYNGFTKRIFTDGVSHNGFIKNTMLELRYLPPPMQQQIVLKNDENFVKKSFNLPDYRLNIVKCKTPIYLNILGNNISQNIISHINAGDLKGAIEKINCTKTTETNLVQVVTQELEMKIKNTIIELDMKSKMQYSSKKAKEDSIEKIKNRIDGLKQRIESIKNKINDNDLCCICYDDIQNITLSPCCNTKYCFECISKCLHQKNSCPFCRATVNFKDLIVVSDEFKDITKEIKKTKQLISKMDNLKIIFKKSLKNPEFKMLIFSDYDNSFADIETLLIDFNIKYSKVMGHFNSVTKILDSYKSYKEDSIKVLLLNANYCASGINLENSTDIVLYHSMNTDKTTQIIGRGQRPGRTQPLNVWKLCYDNEINN